MVIYAFNPEFSVFSLLYSWLSCIWCSLFFKKFIIQLFRFFQCSSEIFCYEFNCHCVSVCIFDQFFNVFFICFRVFFIVVWIKKLQQFFYISHFVNIYLLIIIIPEIHPCCYDKFRRTSKKTFQFLIILHIKIIYYDKVIFFCCLFKYL